MYIFFFNEPATTEIYTYWHTLSLHDALPIFHCEKCRCLLDGDLCFFCDSPDRGKESLCRLASAKDVFALEETREYTGLYHILGSLLSPMEGKGDRKSTRLNSSH